MPFVSQAQRKKFYQLKKEGKMSQSTIDEWESKTPKSLPKKVKNKTKKKSKRCKK